MGLIVNIFVFKYLFVIYYEVWLVIGLVLWKSFMYILLGNK